MWQKLANIDRQVIYALMILVIALSLIKPVGLAIVPSPETREGYTILSSHCLQAASCTLGSITLQEEFLNLCLPPSRWLGRVPEKTVCSLCAGMWVMAGDMADTAFSIAKDEFSEKEYGVDWVNVGYKPGGEVLLQKMLSSVYDAAVGVDHYGNDLKTLPLMAEVPTSRMQMPYSSLLPALPVREYIRHVTSPHNIPFIVSTVSVVYLN